MAFELWTNECDDLFTPRYNIVELEIAVKVRIQDIVSQILFPRKIGRLATNDQINLDLKMMGWITIPFWNVSSVTHRHIYSCVILKPKPLVIPSQCYERSWTPNNEVLHRVHEQQGGKTFRLDSDHKPIKDMYGAGALATCVELELFGYHIGSLIRRRASGTLGIRKITPAPDV